MEQVDGCTSNQSVTTKMRNEVFQYSQCPMYRSMGIVGSKWKPVIIFALRERKARFGQLAIIIGSISRKVLTTMLQELEEEGIILREQYSELPTRVDYSLTEKGLALLGAMGMLVEWDNTYYPAKTPIIAKHNLE